ncbi:MAG: hypothetical protein HY719_13745 [Planctomycetes bacterium]|nr:hypothetical protein [Planctomycetota bacterium]
MRSGVLSTETQASVETDAARILAAHEFIDRLYVYAVKYQRVTSLNADGTWVLRDVEEGKRLDADESARLRLTKIKNDASRVLNRLLDLFGAYPTVTVLAQAAEAESVADEVGNMSDRLTGLLRQFLDLLRAVAQRRPQPDLWRSYVLAQVTLLAPERRADLAGVLGLSRDAFPSDIAGWIAPDAGATSKPAVLPELPKSVSDLDKLSKEIEKATGLNLPDLPGEKAAKTPPAAPAGPGREPIEAAGPPALSVSAPTTPATTPQPPPTPAQGCCVFVNATCPHGCAEQFPSCAAVCPTIHDSSCSPCARPVAEKCLHCLPGHEKACDHHDRGCDGCLGLWNYRHAYVG